MKPICMLFVSSLLSAQVISIPYEKWETARPNPATGERYTFVPSIDILVGSGDKMVKLRATVDSGSFLTLLPASVAERCGINLNDLPDPLSDIGGVGSHDLQVKYTTVKLTVAGISYDAVVGFVREMDERDHGILGFHGFFDHFRITFDAKHNPPLIKLEKLNGKHR